MSPRYQDSTVTIHKFVCGPMYNNAYLVVCPKTNESILIDTPEDPDELVQAAEATDVKAVLITHNHFDHLAGFAEVTGAISAPVGIGEPDANALSRPADFFLTDDHEITAGSVTLRAIATPGHTAGSTCLVMGKHLFTGDTLFPGGPGLSASPENLKQIIESITSRLFVLDDAATFYPGHGDDGKLKTAKEEYAVFAAKDHPPGLWGTISWLSG